MTRSVRLLVGLSVGWLVGWSICHYFLKVREFTLTCLCLKILFDRLFRGDVKSGSFGCQKAGDPSPQVVVQLPLFVVGKVLFFAQNPLIWKNI